MLKIQIPNQSKVNSTIRQDFQRAIETLKTDLVVELRKNTPVATGKARSGWQLNDTGKGFEINNPTPYVGYLDKPYVKSKQAPRGIVGPSLTSIKGKYK